jgi:phosphoribosyl 1,2-cyclic phosphodiesterase
MSSPTHIVFHGVRGSAPASGAAFAEFGGDTPSIEVALGEARLFIDAGSGQKNVRAAAWLPDDFDLVLSHYHYDHLIGLPFFEPAWRMKGRLRIFAPKFGADDPFDILTTFFSSPFCPVRLDDLSVRVDVNAYRPGDSWQAAGGATIATMAVNHPGGCAAIRVSAGAGDLVYASDAEIAGDAEASALADFARRADLFIVDAMNDETNAGARRGWGHSSWRDAVAVGEAAGARATALFHHDPRRSDAALAALDAEARAMSPRAFMVRQGCAFNLKADAARGEPATWRCSR